MYRRILAIDPGSTESAYVEWDRKIIKDKDKVDNYIIIDRLKHSRTHDAVVIEQVRSYGMAVGAEIFDTVHWCGRFHQASWAPVELMPRKDVKLNLCGVVRASDSNIKQALVDRFAYGVRNHGKGTKKEPGFFYGFRKDIWQAYALAVTFFDLKCTMEAKKK